MADEIINRVSQSGLISIDLEDYYVQGERLVYDLKDNLFQGLILREKDFREVLRNTDWSLFSGKFVAITCSVDAIIPTWAYMLLVSKLAPFARKVVVGNLETLEQIIFTEQLKSINLEEYRDAKVVVKGCSKYPVPVSAYADLTALLLPYVSSIMFGEPCSTVPVYKKPKL